MKKPDLADQLPDAIQEAPLNRSGDGGLRFGSIWPAQTRHWREAIENLYSPDWNPAAKNL